MDNSTQTRPPEETSRDRILRRLPIHLQILGGFLALQTTVMVSSFYVIDRISTHQLEKESRRQLEVAATVFQSLVSMRKDQLTQQMTLLSQDFAFKRALATHDTATINSAAINLRERIGANVLWVVDDRGRVVADVSGGRLNLQSLADLSVVISALDQEPRTDILMILGHAYQMGAVPIEAPQVVGAIVAGLEIGPALAQELKQLTVCDVTFAHPLGVVASTLDAAARSVLQDGLSLMSVGETRLIGPKGQRQLVLEVPIGGALLALVNRSWEEAIKPLTRLKRFLLIIGVSGFLLMLFLGYIIAEGVTAVQRRTMAIIQTANEELARLNSFQSKFFAMVTHDVKSPLNTISMFSELLADKAKDPRDAQDAERILNAVKTLDFLISDLVDFAAIENGVLRIDKREMDLEPIFRNLQDRMSIQAAKKQIRFSVKPLPPMPDLEGDARRIEQVIQNLCGNAINYTPEGGTVTLSAFHKNKMIHISVEDSGIGIAPEDRERIFERFFQAENAKKVRRGGFGLGLKIAREIIQAHGGTLSVESVLGKGSTFSFTLRAAL